MQQAPPGGSTERDFNCGVELNGQKIRFGRPALTHPVPGTADAATGFRVVRELR